MSRVVRVRIVDASVQRRQRLQELLEAAPLLQVVDSAATAEDAIEGAARRQADVMVLGQGGSQEALACTRRLMQAVATPVVVITAAPALADGEQAFALMEAGAVAVVGDPGPPAGAQHRKALDALLDTVRLMAQAKVVRRWAPVSGKAPLPVLHRSAAPRTCAAPILEGQRTSHLPRQPRRRIDLVAIGASTGGPVALKQLLRALPADFPVPIVVVQHMAGGFLQGLAGWLAHSCALSAEVARPGTELRPGRIYLAPDGAHMRVAPLLQLTFDAGAAVNGHRPAVSCLLGSVAAHYGSRAVGILLTGMGKDGVAELKLMQQAGAITIAQDAASSVVHGMPGEAILCGAADYVMAPEAIGAELAALLAGKE